MANSRGTTRKTGSRAKSYIVYIVRCADGTLYTGITNDLPKRIEMHRTGKGARYTRSRGVDAVVYTEAGLSRSAALVREAAIKRLTRTHKLALARMKKTS